jgi:photosystem II S4 domain protein
LVELAARAAKNFQVVTTDFFLRPNEFYGAKRALSSLSFVGMTGSGGYATAERQLAAFFPGDFALTTEQEQQLAVSNCDNKLRVLELSGNFLFDRANHSDFLGAVLGSTGLRRERLGDIIVLGDRGAQLIALEHDVQTIRDAVKMVRSTPVQIRVLDSLEELEVRPPRTKAVSSVEASLRLDAVASAGFGMSRSKMAEIITNGDVFVNWVPIKSASKLVAEGDTITVRGRGRLEIIAIATTARGRYRVEMKRFM